MKSYSKRLARNYNADEFDVLCQNRFYGPIVVALNHSQPPFSLFSFTLEDFELVKEAN
jgi:hypothetical protein